MKFHSSLVLLSAALVHAAPVQHASSSCTVKAQRKAWHTLTTAEKLAYLDAEKCLMKLPAKLGLPDLRYWDEPLDAGNFSRSVLLNPNHGFGGNGASPSNCITDGPFVGYVNGIGPGHTISDHCIQRQVSDFMSTFASQVFVDQCYALQTYEKAWPCMEGAPHAGGHGGMGLLMLDPIASPGDPIFYLHHTYLDKVWWGWQALNLPARLSDISGGNVQDPCIGFPENGFPFPGGNGSLPFPFPPNGTFPFPPGPNGTVPFPPNGTFPGGFPPGGCTNTTAPSFPQNEGDPGNVTTLNHVLNMFGIVPNATVKDVMDVSGGFLCYEYV